MDYKIVSPAEYFGTSAAQGHGTLLMNPHVVHGAVNSHVHGGEVVGLNVLASGAVAAGQAQGQGQGQQGQGYPQYGANDNYGYIVRVFSEAIVQFY